MYIHYIHYLSLSLSSQSSRKPAGRAPGGEDNEAGIGAALPNLSIILFVFGFWLVY